MILYLDTSALAKKFIKEAYSAEVVALLGQADLVGASLLARVELPADFGPDGCRGVAGHGRHAVYAQRYGFPDSGAWRFRQ